jgi:cbb3-type cytochrome oxidase subunit 3
MIVEAAGLTARLSKQKVISYNSHDLFGGAMSWESFMQNPTAAAIAIVIAIILIGLIIFLFLRRGRRKREDDNRVRY